MKATTKIFGLCLTAVIVALGGAAMSADSPSAQTVRTDPQHLVTYVMPNGWSNDRIKNGKHYTRVGMPDDPNMLVVATEVRDEFMTFESMTSGRHTVHNAQDHKLVSSKTQSMNGFEAWEGVYEAELRGQPVVMHDYLLFADNFIVDISLNASKPVYQKFLPDLKVVTQSVRAIDNRAQRPVETAPTPQF